MKNADLAQDANVFENAIRQIKQYGHVKAVVERGQIVIYGEDKVARLTPLASGEYGLSFYNSSGKWEQMPFTGNIEEMVKIVSSTLGIYLLRYDFGKPKRRT